MRKYYSIFPVFISLILTILTFVYIKINEYKTIEITINPAIGWQITQLDVKENETICIEEVTGSVHIAFPQIYNALQNATTIEALGDKIIESKSRSPTTFQTSTQPTSLPISLSENDKKTLKAIQQFRRYWVDPEGDSFSGKRDSCLLFRKKNESPSYGALLVNTIKEDKIKKYYEITSKNPLDFYSDDINIVYIPNNNNKNIEITFKNSGTIAFIINDVVGKKREERNDGTTIKNDCDIDAIAEAIDYYKNTIEYSEEYKSKSAKEEFDLQKRLVKEFLPLFWYTDNIGSYHIKMHGGKCVQ